MSESIENNACRCDLVSEAGILLVPIPYREKGPKTKGWNQQRLEEADLRSRNSVARLVTSGCSWAIRRAG